MQSSVSINIFSFASFPSHNIELTATTSAQFKKSPILLNKTTPTFYI
jgi:hypothetical protein